MKPHGAAHGNPSRCRHGPGPDWLPVLLFGLGGLAGMYCGAALQRRAAA